MDISLLLSNLEILPQLLINTIITGSIYAIASAGLALTYGVSRILNFAHGHWMMLGAYTFYAFFSVWEMHYVFAAVLSLLLLLILGSVSYFIFILPFVGLETLLAFVSTLALAAILESAVSLVFGVNVLAFNLDLLGQSLSFETSWFGQFYITPWQIIIILSSLVVLLVLAVSIHCTSFGRKLRSLAENRQASEALASNSNLKLLCCYLLGVVLAGFAGTLVAFETNLQPTMGHTYTIKAFACMILGGLGNIWGAICGAMILGLVENLSIGLDFGGYSLPSGYKDAFAFLIILLALLFKPEGIFKRKNRKI